MATTRSWTASSVQTTPSVAGLHGTSCQGKHHAYGMSVRLIMFTPVLGARYYKPHGTDEENQGAEMVTYEVEDSNFKQRTSSQAHTLKHHNPSPRHPFEYSQPETQDKTKTHNSSQNARELSLGNIFNGEFEQRSQVHRKQPN